MSVALIRRGLDAIQAGRPQQAARHLRKAIAATPLDDSAQHLLGLAHFQQGHPAKALPYFERAARIDPKPWQYHQNLGLALQQLGRPAEARVAFQMAVDRDPRQSESWHNLGTINLELDDLEAAEDALKRAIVLEPAYALAHFNLGCIALTLGDVRQAIRRFGAAHNASPDMAEAHANLIYCRDFLPETTPSMALAERRSWQTRYASPLKRLWQPHPNGRDPDRPLRVGYIGGDFKDHSAALSFAPIVEQHDPDQIHVVLYANQSQRDQDAETVWMRKSAPRWREIAGLPDDVVADLIRADEIDILVELSGFTNRHRLLVVARKPAPVIVTAWGYLTGTGLDAVDAMLADDVTVPPEHERYYAEKIVRLPHALGFAPPGVDVPIVKRPHDAPVTFGHLGRTAKLSDATIALWADILTRLPESRLLLKDAGFSFQRACDRISAAFAAHGIDPSRVEMRGKTKRYEHLAAYNDVDIALDPIPQGGGMTTLESLFMGTPVITMMGDRVPGRTSASTLMRLGANRVPETQEEYVQEAVWLGQNVRSIDLSCLRPHLLGSVICDPVRQARAVESAYRDLFSSWASATPNSSMYGG